MAVYVDDMMADFGRMKMSHLFADTPEELFEMVDAIGVQRKWFQNRRLPHFDICQSKRRLALSKGAVPLEYGVNDMWIDITRAIRRVYPEGESRKVFLELAGMKECG